MNMMLECNLELVRRVLLFANASKSSRKSTHGTRLCRVAQGLYTVLSVIYAGKIFMLIHHFEPNFSFILRALIYAPSQLLA